MKRFITYFYEVFVCCLMVIDAYALVVSDNYTENNPYAESININELSADTDIINYGVMIGTIDIQDGVAATITNYGVINSDVYGSCIAVQQIITDNSAINPIPGLTGHTVIVRNGATDIHLADVIAISSNADEIKLENSGVIVSPGISNLHPVIVIDSTNALNFIVEGLPDDWDSTVPLLTGIHYGTGVHDVQVTGTNPMYVANGYISGGGLYVELERQTDYSSVFEGEVGNVLDILQNENPDDKLLEALDNATTMDELNHLLSQSVRTNPINIMSPLQSFNTFVLGEYLHDLSFGIVAEPFYMYSGDFSVLGGGIGVSGTVAKNLVAKVGAHFGKMNYSSDLDDFNGVIYGTNLGVMYKDSDLYFKAVGTLSVVQFKNIEIFDDENMRSNPNGISGATLFDGGMVFRVFDELDITPFVGMRFDYAHVSHFTDTDTNLRFGLNIDKETVVDGNRYAFGAQIIGQTNGDIYGAIYTDIMSVIDGVGGRLQFGFLHDDCGMSYRISFDAKFVF
ncbi:MAG: autotransporter domain-containing protein [Alphaproteobacteria bacterium]|nr:autotransporter domain-containing protein [Alphaproteobacteria bacterium]